MSKPSFTLHAIQLRNVAVLRLSIKARTFGSDRVIDLKGDNLFSLKFAVGEFDEENSKIDVRVGVNIGGEPEEGEDQLPFDLIVELLGSFEVDTAKFDMNYLDRWSKENAPLLIYPFIRSHVYNLTSTSGFSRVLLPLFELPVLTPIQDGENR